MTLVEGVPQEDERRKMGHGTRRVYVVVDVDDDDDDDDDDDVKGELDKRTEVGPLIYTWSGLCCSCQSRDEELGLE